MLRILGILLVSLTLTATASAQLMDKKALTLDTVKKLAAAAESEAAKNSWRMVIAVVDEGGHLLYLQRADETQAGSVDVAIKKAQSAVMFKRPTKVFEDAVAGGRTAILGPAAPCPSRAACRSCSTASSWAPSAPAARRRRRTARSRRRGWTRCPISSAGRRAAAPPSCDNAADGGAHQRLLLVAEPRQRLPGVQAQVLLPLLRRLGRLGRGGGPGGPTALRPEAARLPPAVGRARRARRGRDGLARLRPGPRHPRRALHRRRHPADAGRVAFLQGGPLPRHAKIDRALRARVPGGAPAGGVAGAQPQRRRVPAELLPPAAHRRDPQDRAGALVDRALVEGLRLRGHGGVGRARLWLLDARRTP